MSLSGYEFQNLIVAKRFLCEIPDFHVVVPGAGIGFIGVGALKNQHAWVQRTLESPLQQPEI